jgi:hypothetical protein
VRMAGLAWEGFGLNRTVLPWAAMSSGYYLHAAAALRVSLQDSVQLPLPPGSRHPSHTCLAAASAAVVAAGCRWRRC